MTPAVTPTRLRCGWMAARRLAGLILWCSAMVAPAAAEPLDPAPASTAAIASEPPSVAATGPQRIVSLNLCTDQLVLMLVERSRIASVSYWAQRPESSYMVERARGLHTNHGLAEEVIPLQPDLVIAGRYTDATSLAILRRLGYPVAVVEVPRNLTEVAGHIREVAMLVHAVEAGEALIGDMQRRIAELRSRAEGQPERLAAIYAPNGVSAGIGTLLDELLGYARLRNLAAEAGIHGYGQLSLERLLVARPDVLVLDATAASGSRSLAHRYLQHPALLRGLADTAKVELPPPLSVCVGPMVVDALELLVAA